MHTDIVIASKSSFCSFMLCINGADASDPASTPGRGTLELDTGYRPSGVGEMCNNL